MKIQQIITLRLYFFSFFSSIATLTFAQTTYNVVGSYQWTVPACVTSVTVQVWGGGGGGGGAWVKMDNSTNDAFGNPVEACAGGGGGGGGSFSTQTFAVTPGQIYDIVVGAGGVGGTSVSTPININSVQNGGRGDSSTFKGNSYYLGAAGGNGGLKAYSYNSGFPSNNLRTGGAGGTGGIGRTFNGGNGTAGSGGSSFDFSGAGGGGAGTGGNGGNANGAVVPHAGGSGAATGGGNGANGFNLVNGTRNGAAGSIIGGGGAAGVAHTTGFVNPARVAQGGAGARGEVRLIYSASGAPTASAVATNNTSCSTPNGSIDLTTTGVSYVWSNGAITEDISGLSAGTYTVTVTASGGCSATASATVNNATSNPTASAVASNNTSCSSPNGSVNLTTTGTSYIWSNGAITEDLSGLSSGTYTVTVTAANGCTATTSAAVNNVPANPSASAVANDNTNCVAPFSGNVNLTTSGSSYIWSNGAITEDLSALNTGTYTVTVTAANGCTATTSATVNSTNSLGSFSTSSLPNTVCNGSTIPCSYSGPAVVINEIMFMPGSNYSISGGDNTNASLQSMYNTTNSGEEWIELYNPNPCQALDLSCYIIGSSTGGSNFGAFSFPSGTSIPPLGFLVIGGTNASNVDINLNNFVGTSNLAGSTRWHLENGCGYILLANPSGGIENAIYWSQNNAADLTAATTCGGSFNRALTIPAICSPLINPLPEARNIPGIEYAGNFGATAQGTSVIGRSIIRSIDGGTSFLISNTGGSPGSCNGVCTPPFSGGSSCDGEASINFSSASGLTYAWNDPLAQTTDTAKGLCPGLYTVTVTNSSGCSVTTSIAVDDSSSLITITSTNSDNSRCIAPFNGSIDLNTSGTSYIWSNGAITEDLSGLNSGTYTVTVTGSGACSATASITINSNSGNQNGIDSITSCSSYTWINGTTYTSSNNTATYTISQGASNGCDSIVSLFLIVSNDSTFEFNTSCNPADTGVVVLNLTSQYSCDSVHIITTNLQLVDSTFEFSSSCNPADTGVFIFNGINQFGCDSIHTLSVALSPPDSTFEFNFSCNPLDTGVFVSNGVNQFGCDSVHTITTTLQLVDSTFEFSSSCLPADTGVFVFNGLNQFGCDSVHTITVTLSPSDSTFEFNTSANPADTGVVVFTGINQFGCDSVHTITTTLLAVSDSTFEFTTSCNPADTGVFVFTYLNQSGADSIHIVTTTLLPSSASSESRTTCDQSAVGVVTLNLINQFGCDSLHTITTTLTPGDATFENRTTCDQNAVGVVTLNLINQAGCDSVHTITTTLTPGDATFENRTTCDPNAVGTFTFNLTNRLGCDSVHTVTYSLSPDQSRNVFVNLCRGDAVFAGGGLQTTDGTYVDNFFTAQGCDSTVTTYVTVNELPIVSIAVPQDTIIRGESIVLSAVSNVAVSTYLWNPPTALSCDQCQNPTASPNSNIIYILNVTDVNGCSANAFTRITVLSDSCNRNIFIPSAFTPNGDGNNDVFQIYGNCIASMKMRIFNRWGELVFESNDINQAWDGTYKGAVVFGVYTYTLNVEFKDGRKDNSNERRGSITLIR